MQKLKLAGAILGISATGAVTPFVLPSNTQNSATIQQESSNEQQRALTAENVPDVASTETSRRAANFQAQQSLSDDLPVFPGTDGAYSGSPSAAVAPPMTLPTNLPPITTPTASNPANALPLPGGLPDAGGYAESPNLTSKSALSGQSRSSSSEASASAFPQAYSATAGTAASNSNPVADPSPVYSLGDPSPSSGNAGAGTFPAQSGSRATGNGPNNAASIANSGAYSPSPMARSPRQTLPGQLAGYQQPSSKANGQGTGLRAIGAVPQSNSAGVYPSPSPTLPKPERANTGRYATRPYNHALFQTAAFQRGEKAQSLSSNYSPAGQVPANQRDSSSTQGQLVATPPTYSQRPQTPSMPPEQFVGVQSTLPSSGLPQFVTPANSPVVTMPPSGGGAGMAPPPAQASGPNISQVPAPGQVPGTSTPPTYTPDYAPSLYASGQAGAAPLITLGQQKYNVVMGRGIIGQPTVYVPGQPVRNFMRYIFP